MKLNKKKEEEIMININILRNIDFFLSFSFALFFLLHTHKTTIKMRERRKLVT
jgi:hypothetical protein